MIKVILLERIERLGKMGDTVTVRPGYARNYLLPQKKALRATKDNLALFEKQRAELEAKNETLKTKAAAVAKDMKDLSVVLIRQASEMGMLFGSVTSRDVAAEIRKKVDAVERNMVQIDTPIKTLGLFTVKVKLHPEVITSVTVNVARSEAEASAQVEKEAQAVKDAEKAAKAEAEFASVAAIGTETPAEAEEKEAE
jgi:large subunit ribosomal protein L9